MAGKMAHLGIFFCGESTIFSGFPLALFFQLFQFDHEFIIGDLKIAS